MNVHKLWHNGRCHQTTRSVSGFVLFFFLKAWSHQNSKQQAKFELNFFGHVNFPTGSHNGISCVASCLLAWLSYQPCCSTFYATLCCWSSNLFSVVKTSWVNVNFPSYHLVLNSVSMFQVSLQSKVSSAAMVLWGGWWTVTHSGVTGHSLWMKSSQLHSADSAVFASGSILENWGQLACTSSSPVSVNIALFAHFKVICCTWF